MKYKNTQHVTANNNFDHVPDAAPSGTDLRVSHLLRDAKVPYDLLPDGTYVLRPELDSGRDCMVYVNSKTHWLGGMELRHLVTCALSHPKPLPSTLAETLLCANALMAFEKWELFDAGDAWAVFLSGWVSVDAAETELLSAVHSLAGAADLLAALDLTDSEF